MGNSARVNTATIWRTLSESNSVILDDYRALYATADGNIVIDDAQDNEVTFPVTAGQILPVQPKRLKTDTNIVVIGLN